VNAVGLEEIAALAEALEEKRDQRNLRLAGDARVQRVELRTYAAP
jgi:hypothetical protein